MRAASIAVIACLFSRTIAQTFQRLGGCPELGCVFPPDQYVLLLFYLLRLGRLLDTVIPISLGNCLDRIPSLCYILSRLPFVALVCLGCLGDRHQVTPHAHVYRVTAMISLFMCLFVFSHPGPITFHHN